MIINEILNQDCNKGLFTLNKESIDLIITSPPYKDEDGYHKAVTSTIFLDLYNVAKKNSLFFLNFGHLANFKTRPFEVLSLATSAGWKLADTFIWIKNHYKPIQGKKRVNNLTEFVFMLYKHKIPVLDRLSIGVPYVDKSNIKRFYKEGKSDIKCRGNVWHIPYDTINKKEDKLHHDRFPLKLPEYCIKLSNINRGSLVLDPFMGSGTTALAAKQLGMNYLGFEINKEYIDIANLRLNNDKS